MLRTLRALTALLLLGGGVAHALPVGPAGVDGGAAGTARVGDGNGAAAGPALDGRAAFDAAVALIGKDDAAAEARLEALALREPTGDFADEALLEAAELSEEKLARPDRARDLYAELLRAHPGSRHALRARNRKRFLDANLRTGAAPLAEYQRILNGYPSRPPLESARLMTALIDAHPDFALVDKGLLWLAGVDLREGRYADAERHFLDVERRFPDGEAHQLAQKGRADVALADGHPFAARRLYLSLGDEHPSAEIAAAAAAGSKAARRAIARLLLFLAALGYLAAYLGYALLPLLPSLSRARREKNAAPAAGRALPFELYFYLPVAAVFVFAALAENGAIAMAVSLIAGGGGAVLLGAARLTARSLARGPISSGRRTLQACATALAILAVAYAAVHTARLTDFLIETIRSGPDR